MSPPARRRRARALTRGRAPRSDPCRVGHELAGNQLAYTYLSFANATLNDLLASSTPRTDAERYARRSKRGPPLPPPLFCKGPACAGRPRCALAAPAARETLAVADLVSNATARARKQNGPSRCLRAWSGRGPERPLDVSVTFRGRTERSVPATTPRRRAVAATPAERRRHAAATPPPRCRHAATPPRRDAAQATGRTRWTDVAVADVFQETDDSDDDPCADEASRACYDRERARSHGDDAIRAFAGNPGAGALQLDLDFRKRAACVVLIAEPLAATPRPLLAANWRAELDVRVEGEACGPPACTAHHDDGAATLVVDLTKLEGCDSCSRCWELKPVPADRAG